MGIIVGIVGIIVGIVDIIVGTMSNGHGMVEHWTQLIENEHFRGGTMQNVYVTIETFDGTMDNAGGTMYIELMVPW